jgi:hypothetical protein
MNFIVEDGTGLDDSTSFVSVAEADAYISTFVPNDAGWSGKTVREKESLLMRATRFINTLMGWNSSLLSNTQSLSFPRKTFLDRDGREVSGVPSLIKEYTSAMAVESISTDLNEEAEKLISESFGDTSDTYAAPVIRGGSEVVRRAIKELSHMGYGSSRTTIVRLERA